MQRFRTSGSSSVIRSLKVPQLRRKAANSWSAIQDTYFSIKDTFERHKVVFTVSTSIASVATAWIGYSLRHYHESRVDQRLESIEMAMKNNYQIGDPEFKKLVSTNVSLPSCLATAGTTLTIGYGLGWRGGRWYENRKHRREQMKLLGKIKPRRPLLKFLYLMPQIEPRRSLLNLLRRPSIRSRAPEKASKPAENLRKNASVTRSSRENHIGSRENNANLV